MSVWLDGGSDGPNASLLHVPGGRNCTHCRPGLGVWVDRSMPHPSRSWRGRRGTGGREEGHTLDALTAPPWRCDCWSRNEGGEPRQTRGHTNSPRSKAEHGHGPGVFTRQPQTAAHARADITQPACTENPYAGQGRGRRRKSTQTKNRENESEPSELVFFCFFVFCFFICQHDRARCMMPTSPLARIAPRLRLVTPWLGRQCHAHNKGRGRSPSALFGACKLRVWMLDWGRDRISEQGRARRWYLGLLENVHLPSC